MQQFEQPRTPLTIEFLMELRNTIELSKFNDQDPAFASMQLFIEQNLEDINVFNKKEAQQDKFYKEFLRVAELTRFMYLHLLDFLIASRGYISATSRWSKLFFCRQLALIIYEFINDINPLINQTLKNNDAIKVVDSNIMTDLYDTVKKLSFIQRLKYDEYLKIIRNETAAHRKKIVQEQYDLIKNLDEKLIIACSLFTFFWVIELFSKFADLTKHLMQSFPADENLPIE